MGALAPVAEAAAEAAAAAAARGDGGAGAAAAGAPAADADSDPDDDGSASECEEEVMLGFAERPRARAALRRGYFPSTLGGAPAWLAPPGAATARAAEACGACGGPMRLLAQVYAPVEPGDAVGGGGVCTFHRAVYVFACRDGRCVAADTAGKATLALRAQLPRDNEHFGFDPLPEPETDSDSDSDSGEGEGEGGGEGGGEEASAGGSEGGGSAVAAAAREWPELELVVEPEAEHLGGGVSVDALLERYRAAERADSAGDAHGLPKEGVPSGADLQMDAERRQWVAFQARCAAAPRQVLRYCRSPSAAAPLWPRRSPAPPRPPPRCERCGGERVFECQLLPQALHYARESAAGDRPDALDFGTLAVYTCRDNCSLGDSYAREYIFVQPPSE